MTRLIVKQNPSPSPAGRSPHSVRPDSRGGARSGQDVSVSPQRGGGNASAAAPSHSAASGLNTELLNHEAGNRVESQAKSRARDGTFSRNEWEAEAGAAWGNSENIDKEYENYDGYHSPTEELNSADEHEYNSGDEAARGQNKENGFDLDEEELEMILRKAKGFRIKKMGEDGNCLFRAISDQVFGDPGMHTDVRVMCVDYLLAERDHFSQFVTEDFDEYLRRKRQDKVYGNNVELQAISEMYNRPIEVYRSSATPMKIFHEVYDADCATPIRLSYHRGNHYNSVINPNENSVGEGLGLPGYQQPAQRIEEECEKTVLRESEQEDLEAKLLESALKDSEEQWEQTQVNLQLEALTIQQSRAEYWGGSGTRGGSGLDAWMADGGSAAGARPYR